MSLDHVGASLLENFILNIWGASPVPPVSLELWNSLYEADRVLRALGKPAFPLFCFLLVEGFLHTRDVKKYVLRLGIFAFISELPFDLAFWNRGWYPDHQNVFFTLFLSALTLWAIRDGIWGLRRSSPQFCGETMTTIFLSLGAGCVLAELLRTDYGAYGVLLVVALYCFRRNRLLQCAFGALCFSWEKTAFPAFLFLLFYNGQRGRQPKWFFYWFYPAHLALFWAVGNFLLPMMAG